MIVGPSPIGAYPIGPLVFTTGTMEHVVAALRLRAARGEFDGTSRRMPYLRSCTADHVPSGTRLIFTRDTGHHTSGWFKNPDYERCLHLSTSYREPDAGGRLAQNHRRTYQWARLFFGDTVRLAWTEPPVSERGKASEVWHYRVFCDAAWGPITPRGEVYSTEFTELGWKSFSELGADVSSPLYPG